MDQKAPTPEMYDILDDSVDEWFEIAEQDGLRFPITFAMIGRHGQYLCGELQRDSGGRYRVKQSHEPASLFTEPPHHTLLIDSAGGIIRLSSASGSEPSTTVH